MAGAFIDRFSDRASLYRRSRPTYPSQLFDDLAALAPGRDLAWDCGTGNGQAAVALACHFHEVYATDPSAQQIAEASSCDQVSYRVERAEDVSLPDGSVDLVLAAQALHWFDHDTFFVQARRVLKPGGIVAAIGYDWMYVDPGIDDAINKLLLPLLAEHWAPQNALLWAGYRTISFPGDELRLGAYAIRVDWNVEEASAYISSWSASRALRAAGGGERLDAALAELKALWGGERRRVTMPLFTRVARMA